MTKLLTFTILISLLGCESKVDGFFFITNTSQDQSEIPLRLIVDNDTVFNQNVKWTNIRPDLQHIENEKLTKGKHKIIFEVANTKLRRIENVEFDKDKWIFVSYGYKKAPDSLQTIELTKVLEKLKIRIQFLRIFITEENQV